MRSSLGTTFYGGARKVKCVEEGGEGLETISSGEPMEKCLDVSNGGEESKRGQMPVYAFLEVELGLVSEFYRRFLWN